MSGTVLVTGATGFVARHVVRALLHAGYSVRGTVRAEPRRPDVYRGAGIPDGDPRLDVVVADLAGDAGWREAAQGCSAVLHIASPFPLADPRDRESVIRPARDGTRRVLAGAAAAGCRRVILTSSIVAVIYGRDAGPRARPYDETDWTDPSRRDLTSYVVSKTLAEQTAWSIAREDANSLDLTVLNPGLVLGPALGRDLSSSHEVVRMLATGKYPAVPKVGYAIVDIRDVADAHVRALESPASAGERFIIANGFLTFREMAGLVARTLPDLARRVPKFEVPDAMVRMMSVADRSLAAVLPDLGRRRTVSNAKAQAGLGLAFRPPQEAVAAAAKSLRDLGLV